MYKIGDKIVYSVHGAGKIVDIKEIDILGEEKEYYILELPINNISVSIPVDEVDDMVIRPVISLEEGKKVREILTSDCGEMPKNWGKRYRENLSHIKTGDIFEIAEIVKNLSALDQQKGLSASEKKMLTNAKRIIVSELVIIGALKKDEAEDMIDELITIEED